MKRWLAVSFACLLLSAPTGAAEKPKAKDCSTEPAPDGKLVLRIDDKAYPLPIAMMRSQQEMSIGGETEEDKESFEVFAFSLRDAESIFPPHEVEVSVMVSKGEKLDGRTFRHLPVEDMKLQPTPVKSEGSWMPEIQSVEVSSEPDGIDYEHGVLTAVRIEFGTRTGDVLPGKLRLCIAPGQTDSTFLPEPTRAIVVEGAFEAKEGL